MRNWVSCSFHFFFPFCLMWALGWERGELWQPWPLLGYVSTEPRTESCHSRHSVSIDWLMQTSKEKGVNGQNPTGKLITQSGWAGTSSNATEQKFAKKKKVLYCFKDCQPSPLTLGHRKKKECSRSSDWIDFEVYLENSFLKWELGFSWKDFVNCEYANYYLF